VQVRVQVTWRTDRWWKALLIKLFGTVHVAVLTVIMSGVSSLLCSLLKSQLLYVYLDMLVCLLMSSVFGDQRLQLQLQFFLKNGQFICRTFVLWKVFQVSWNLCLKVRHCCHTSGVRACVHTPQRVCCFLSRSEGHISLVSIFNFCLF